jgi:hypothetical protein
MNIVMLGHSGVGKTTFMASMYNQMQQSTNGFTFTADSNDDHRRLISLARNISVGSYPAGTHQRAQYRFKLCYHGEKVLPFRWVDYRGSATSSRTREDEQAGQLYNDLRAADAIILFCACDVLMRKDTREMGLGRLMGVLSNVLKDTTTPKPLAITISKFDLYGEFDERLISPLRQLIETVNVSEYVIGTLIPVACGRNPYNVAIPALFALRIGILIKAKELSDELEEIVEKRDRYANKIGFWDEFWCSFSDEKSWSEMAMDEQKKLIAKYEVFEKLVDPADALEEYLKDLPTF